MNGPPVFFWKKSPLIRILVPFVAGILLQWYGDVKPVLAMFTAIISFILMTGFFLFSFFHRYKLSFLSGVANFLLFASLAALLTFRQDIRHDSQWFGHVYKQGVTLVVTLEEPPVEKTRSFKAEAGICFIRQNDEFSATSGKLIIYFQKEPGDRSSDPIARYPGYGSQLIINKPLQEITSSGNPGSFDYKQYCLFQGITHQVFLKPGEFEIVIPGRKNGKNLAGLIYDIREKLLSILRSHITKEKELGLAEALLIGYKNDLDKSLVQSYSNTGVVHIIAISGLHLSLIYWLLAKLLLPLQKKKKIRWLSPVLLITCLWLFSLLAGAQPSVLRSALMFTCIIAGKSLTRKTTIYNTLALSAFLLLCYNPFWLWDTGFQLSYAAVTSLIIFMRPVYSLLYCKHPWADALWKMNAVTIAAQVLTFPLCIYYFHQFPNYFLLTNLLAVPLSSLILLIEILLCCIAFIPGLAILTGKLLTWLIGLMNRCIETMESFPFSVWNGLQLTPLQALLLLVCIAGLGYAWMERSKAGLKTGMAALLCLAVLRYASFSRARTQQRIIVYNMPRTSAIDFINGRHHVFIGDSTDELTSYFYLRPSRILHRTDAASSLENLIVSGNYITFNKLHILVLDDSTTLETRPQATTLQQEKEKRASQKQIIDLLVISQNPQIAITGLAKQVDIKQVVFDASVPAWKINSWEKDCDLLNIPCHDVTAKGAFAMNLP